MSDIWDLLARLIILLVMLPIHEYAHGLAASRLGDDTPARQGRLTLNPFRHLNLFGSMALLLIGFGWAKPVIVDPRNFKNPKRDMALTALAGPVANIVMAFAVIAVYKIFTGLAGDVFFFDTVATVLILTAIINVRLAVFNLLPIPPLDGSKILGFFLPDRIYMHIARFERYIMLVVLALLWTNMLSAPIEFLSGGMLWLLDLLTLPIDLILR